ncbi:MBL fold metallo-hydrolase RNA specificity domain-containing protein [Desulfobacter vibrioformis]|uniref:MBL fold metallo-hydrolase RNA specificity domain-containing protein n=1 Tax=Desulfobacter vibrioformis TaxID=34031 RepID=UPI000550C6DF|nr:MBL fold metallo-hydrolase [Desulfobacter vibrioformis]
MVEVGFFGAAGEVTGSMHMLDTGVDKILLDCGMFQGRRKESREKNENFLINRSEITTMVLSHAHIDHSGRIPLLTKEGFSGRIVTTRPTKDALDYMLLDSGHIQESDAQYLNYKALRAFLYQAEQSKTKQQISNKEKAGIKKLLKKSPHELNVGAIAALHKEHGLGMVTPLYTQEEALESLSFIDGYPFGSEVTIGKGTTVKFYVAGHILGSAFSLITVKPEHGGKPLKILFTGDVGRFGKPILKDPTLEFDEEDRDIDLMIIESTYGDREHAPVADLAGSLKETLTRTIERGGSLLIPSFAFGRTQELIYILHQLYDSGTVPKVPIYVDSPLASNITKVFGEHPETYDKETHKTFLEKGINPFYFKDIKFVESVEESMRVTQDDTPHIVISASGMCEAGRILHHLRYKIHNPKHTILIVGYMASHTLGRRIEELGLQRKQASGKAPEVKILGKAYPLRAHVEKLGGFSAHADCHELMQVVAESNLRVKKIAVVHGEAEQSAAFAQRLNENGYDAFVPKCGDVFKLA